MTEIKVVRLKEFLINDSFTLKEFDSFETFTELFPLDEEHSYYDFHDGCIYAMIEDSRIMNYVEVPKDIQIIDY